MSCIQTEIDQLDAGNPAGAMSQDSEVVATVQSFVRMVEANPGLRAAAADRFEQLIRLAADALAAQTGMPAESPRNQIVAGALVSLWRLHLSALLSAGERSLPLGDVADHVRHQVHEAADLVERLMRSATVTRDLSF